MPFRCAASITSDDSAWPRQSCTLKAVVTSLVARLRSKFPPCRGAARPRRFDQLARTTPVIGNIRPGGRFLMEDLYYAGGLRALLARLGDLIHRDAATVTGRTLGEEIAGAEVYDDEVIRPLDRPVSASGGLAILHGTLAPEGAVIKTVAASPRCCRHRGPGRRVRGLQRPGGARIDDPSLPITSGLGDRPAS